MSARNPIDPTAGNLTWPLLPAGLPDVVRKAIMADRSTLGEALAAIRRNWQRIQPTTPTTPTTIHKAGEVAPYLSGDVIVAATAPLTISQDAGTNTETWGIDLAAVFDAILAGGNGSGGGSLIGTPVSLPGSGTTRTLTAMGNYAFSGGGSNFDLILPTLDGSMNENGMVILRETAGAGVTITLSGDGFAGPPPAVPVDINGGATYVWTVPSFGYLWLQNDGVQWVVVNIGP